MYNKGLISNSFIYEGKINIKLKNKEKSYTLKAHNTGTKLLVNTIAKALSGANISENIPRYLDFIYGEKENGEYKNKPTSILKSIIPFTGKVYGDVAKTPELAQDENCSCLLLSATISANDRHVVQNAPNKQLRMLNSNQEALAIIENKDNLLDLLYESLKDGTDAILEWRMIFSNKIAEENNENE